MRCLCYLIWQRQVNVTLEKLKLLIADATEEFCLALEEQVNDSYEIRCCHEGNEALQMIRLFKPHILVLDLMMPGLDGITILQRAAEEGFSPMVLVTTRFQSDYILNTIAGLGVGYVMVKPCDIKATAARLQDLCQHLKQPRVSAPDYRTQVTNIMRRLGLSTKLRGYAYLREVILEEIMHPGQMVTKELYPDIGARSGASKDQVERAIRGTIKKAWIGRDEQVWKLYFPPDPNGNIPRPTNGAFIAQIADYVKTGRTED